MSTLRSKLTYANVMATIAVFVALGGSGYAALRITSKNVPKDALTGADIKNLTGADVKNESLDSRDVRNLRGSDFRPGELAAGARGPQGLQGRTGPAGPGVERETTSNPGESTTQSFAFVSLGDATATIDVPAGGAFINYRFAGEIKTVNQGLVECGEIALFVGETSVSTVERCEADAYGEVTKEGENFVGAGTHQVGLRYRCKASSTPGSFFGCSGIQRADFRNRRLLVTVVK